MKTKIAVVMVSRRCNMSCGHCSVESHPKIKTQPTAEELHCLVDELITAGADQLQFTGGEPMLRGDLVLELMARAKAQGVGSTMVSNGFWGKKKEKALSTLKELRAAGLRRLALSYDRYHAEFQGPEPLVNILDAVQTIGWNAHINITRTRDESGLAELVAPFEHHPCAQLRFYDIQPVGLAKNLKDTMRGQLDGFCSACDQLTFTDNGRVIACNGPAYFEKSDSALVLGRWRDHHNKESFLEQHGQDPILETIRVLGPMALKKELEQTEGFENFKFRDEYRGMCELCLHITSNPKVSEALRKRLSEPARKAELLARKLVRDKAAQSTYNRFEINFRIVAIEFLKILLDSPSPESDKAFGRADLDWAWQAERLQRAGLLKLFQEESRRERLRNWAPSFFWEKVETEAEQKMDDPGLEGVLRAWYDRDGADGYRCLFLVGQEQRWLQGVADSTLGNFWEAARAILAEDLGLGSPVKRNWLRQIRYKILRYRAFQEQEKSSNVAFDVVFPLVYATPYNWAKCGLRSLKRLAKEPGAFLRAIPEAIRHGKRLSRRSSDKRESALRRIP